MLDRLRRGGPEHAGEANFLLAGQSNVAQWTEADDGAAAEEFRRTYAELRPECATVGIHSVARGGSAVLRESAEANARDLSGDEALTERVRRNYWCEDSDGTAGPSLERAVRKIRAWRDEGVRFDGIIWSQGEADALHWGRGGDARYRSALETVLLTLREAAGSPPVHIQELGQWSAAGTAIGAGIEGIRSAQRDLASAHPGIDIASTTFDLPLSDPVHLTGKAYGVAARRMAVAIAAGECSPLPSSAGIDGEGRIEIRVPLAPGQRLDPCEGTTGWKLSDVEGDVAVNEVRTRADGRIVVVPDRPVTRAIVRYADIAVVGSMSRADFLIATGFHLALPVRPFALAVR